MPEPKPPEPESVEVISEGVISPEAMAAIFKKLRRGSIWEYRAAPFSFVVPENGTYLVTVNGETRAFPLLMNERLEAETPLAIVRTR